MLTRIEIDGFKSFQGFSLDLSPFSVILGANASGKSNLFDAIQLLSNLATQDVHEAIKGLRGEAHELFRQTRPHEPVARMTLAVDVLVDPRVRDSWGREVELKHTRLRYRVAVERVKDERGIERLIIADEEAVPILAKDEPWAPSGLSLKEPSAFKKAYVRYHGRTTPWLETRHEGDGKVLFELHQDGSQGRKRKIEAHLPQATVLSSITTATEFAHLFALRQELRSWRLLQLDPASLRQPSPVMAPDVLLPDGSNLAAVLARIKVETSDPDTPAGSLSELAAELADIIPGVCDVDVEEDSSSREYRAVVSVRDGFSFPTRVISDGTLRVLALLTALHDPDHRGLICFEEPENGIHPARLEQLIRKLRERVTDPADPELDGDEPLAQLLMNSHSPVVLSALKDSRDSQIFFADTVAVVDPERGLVERKTRIRPVTAPVQVAMDLETQTVSKVVTDLEVARYLNTVKQGV